MKSGPGPRHSAPLRLNSPGREVKNVRAFVPGGGMEGEGKNKKYSALRGYGRVAVVTGIWGSLTYPPAPLGPGGRTGHPPTAYNTPHALIRRNLELGLGPP